MKKLGNYLWVEKEGDFYTLSMTPELQDDVGTVGYVEFTRESQVEAGDSLLSLEASKTVLDIFHLCLVALWRLTQLLKISQPCLTQPIQQNLGWCA